MRPPVRDTCARRGVDHGGLFQESHRTGHPCVSRAGEMDAEGIDKWMAFALGVRLTGALPTAAAMRPRRQSDLRIAILADDRASYVRPMAEGLSRMLSRVGVESTVF